jgi:hypothetical protein
MYLTVLNQLLLPLCFQGVGLLLSQLTRRQQLHMRTVLIVLGSRQASIYT